MEPEASSDAMRLPFKLLQLAMEDIARNVDEASLEASEHKMLQLVMKKANLFCEGYVDRSIEPRFVDPVQATNTPVPMLPHGWSTLCPTLDNKQLEEVPPAGQVSISLPNHLSGTAQKGEEFSMEDMLSCDKWQQVLIDMFTSLDADHNNKLACEELKIAMQAIRIPDEKATEFLNKFDVDHSGYIERREWIRVIRSNPSFEMKHFAQMLHEFAWVDSAGRLSFKNQPWYMISCRSKTREIWDLIIIVMLGYLAIVMPLFVGLDIRLSDFFLGIEYAVEVIFLADLMLNFQTSYISIEGAEIFSWRRVAKHYLKTWFMLDLISSIPFQMLHGRTDSLKRTGLLKLFKVGKVLRAFKLIRMTRILKLVHHSELVHQFEELKGSSDWRVTIKVVTIFFSTIFVCHWLACGMAYSGFGYFTKYFNPMPSKWSLYLAALYWAMTTMTTVGYGDITPSTDWERAYAMLAMVIGGSYYGYVIGEIASIIAHRDLYTAAYSQLMDLILAWLHHHQFPSGLRSRVQHYFRAFLSQHSAIDETAIVNDLSAALRRECKDYMIHDNIRCNALLDGLPSAKLRCVADQLQMVVAEANDLVVREGDPGTAMFILFEGAASVKASKTASFYLKHRYARVFGPGDSFGEEILLNCVTEYQYTVAAQGKCLMYSFTKAAFDTLFGDRPDLRAKMLGNMTGNFDASPSNKAQQCVKSTLALNHTASQFPCGFVDAVLVKLNEIDTHMKQLTQ